MDIQKNVSTFSKIENCFYFKYSLNWSLILMLCCSVLSNCLWSYKLAHQASLTMRCSRQEYWSGLPLPSPGDLLNPGIETAPPMFPALDFKMEILYHWATWEVQIGSYSVYHNIFNKEYIGSMLFPLCYIHTLTFCLLFSSQYTFCLTTVWKKREKIHNSLFYSIFKNSYYMKDFKSSEGIK